MRGRRHARETHSEDGRIGAGRTRGEVGDVQDGAGHVDDTVP